MVLLEPDSFLNELNKMYERNKTKGSVSVNMKRTNLKPRKSRTLPEQEKLAIHEGNPDFKCIVRASDGKKKISTVVSAAIHLKFQTSFNTILKAHMDALKKREKTKVKKEGVSGKTTTGKR